MHPNQQSNLLKIASQAAVQAGHFLAQSRQVSRRVDFESAHDIKIQADKQSQKIILKFLGRETGLPIIAEEKKFQGITKKLTWVVDPLDGTLNFARRIPISCV